MVNTDVCLYRDVIFLRWGINWLRKPWRKGLGTARTGEAVALSLRVFSGSSSPSPSPLSFMFSPASEYKATKCTVCVASHGIALPANGAEGDVVLT